jgi:hypothetical protein
MRSSWCRFVTLIDVHQLCVAFSCLKQIIMYRCLCLCNIIGPSHEQQTLGLFM